MSSAFNSVDHRDQAYDRRSLLSSGGFIGHERGSQRQQVPSSEYVPIHERVESKKHFYGNYIQEFYSKGAPTKILTRGE